MQSKTELQSQFLFSARCTERVKATKYSSSLGDRFHSIAIETFPLGRRRNEIEKKTDRENRRESQKILPSPDKIRALEHVLGKIPDIWETTSCYFVHSLNISLMYGSWVIMFNQWFTDIKIVAKLNFMIKCKSYNDIFNLADFLWKLEKFLFEHQTCRRFS